MDDTGQNIAEIRETLLMQQRQLLQGKRVAQMFPKGTQELPVPVGFSRIETERGVFHYNPDLINGKIIWGLSEATRENEILALGPYSKADVLEKFRCGEELVSIVERLNGVEVKAAVGTASTLPEQLRAFEATKLDGSTVQVEPITKVLIDRMTGK